MNINRLICILAVFNLWFSSLAKDADDGLLIVFPDHKRISHSHASNGAFYHTSMHKRMAVFSFYNERYHFSRGGEAELKKAAGNGGMGFMQWYIIEKYNQRPYCYKHNKKICFRALCELNGKLCIFCPFPIVIII